MSLELEMKFTLKKPDRPGEAVVTFGLPPDVTDEQIYDIIRKTHDFVSELFDFKGGKHGG